MVQRSILDRFCIWWWDEKDDAVNHIARLFNWPCPIETDNVEVLSGGDAWN